MTLIFLSDDVFLLQALEKGLKEHCPFAVVVGHCYTVEEGLKAIYGLHPDVVILDIEMPKVKQQGILTLLPSKGFWLIALTAKSAVLNELKQQGYRLVLSNPIDLPLLVQILKHKFNN